jgi:hypothetical protein
VNRLPSVLLGRGTDEIDTTDSPISDHRRKGQSGVDKKDLVAFGVLFIGTFITSIPAPLLYGPVLNHADYIVGAGADTRGRGIVLRSSAQGIYRLRGGGRTGEGDRHRDRGRRDLVARMGRPDQRHSDVR